MCGLTSAHGGLVWGIGVLAVSLSAISAPALAQSGSASGVISGTIQDESGGALPGVTATLTSPALQVPQIVVASGADGSYRFGELPVGIYAIKFELGGFRTVIRDELR